MPPLAFPKVLLNLIVDDSSIGSRNLDKAWFVGEFSSFGAEDSLSLVRGA